MTARSYLLFDGSGAIAAIIYCDDYEIIVNTPPGLIASAGSYRTGGDRVDVNAANAKNIAVKAAKTPEALAAAYALNVLISA